MAFWKSDDEEKKEEMEEVKKRVEGRETKLPKPPEPPSPPQEEEEVEIKETPERETPSFEENTPSTEPAPSQQSRDTRTQTGNKGSQAEAPKLETTRRPPQRRRGGEGDEDFAPLFVKIDQYRQVLQNLEEVKNTLQSLRDLFSLMQELDQIKSQGMKELRQGISNLAQTLISMDEKFIRPAGTEEMIKEPESGVSETVQQLQNELKSVRQELDRME